MGWVEAVVQIVTGLAWPGIVLTAILMFRKRISGLIDRIRHAELPGSTFDFADQAAATNDLSAASVPNSPDELPAPTDQPTALPRAPLPGQPSLPDLLHEADDHPVGAVVRAWNLVEAAAGTMVHDLAMGHRVVPVMRRLHRDNIVTDDHVGLAERLSTLRNRVVHGQVVPDPAAARDFVEAAWRLASLLDSAATVFPNYGSPSP